MTKLIYSGIFLILLPIPVMATEYLWALLTGASGERLASAGFWGVATAYYLSPLGVGLLLLGLLIWLMKR